MHTQTHRLQPWGAAGLSVWRTPLRAWQERAFESIRECPATDYLAVATPGAGKTALALRVAHDFLVTQRARRVTVVCPTNHLRRQWAEAAGRVGLQLDPSVPSGNMEQGDYHGMAISYQQLCGDVVTIHRACLAAPTLIILDEIHHAADGRNWGEALRTALRSAVFRLALSGTPFRSDSAEIPFVRYQDGVSLADFAYSYGDALRDGLCRPIIFPLYGGTVSWQTASGAAASANFSDDLPEPMRRERLKAAVLHRDWIEPVLKQAHAQLLSVRKQQAEAGGLVIAMTQDHARELAARLKLISGSDVHLAISDDPDAARTIRQFAGNRAAWLVAVNMVSEGVDIPRLRVGVFATNILTELYFRQAAGRFVRRQARPSGAQRAYLYMPNDPVLFGYAQRIGEERDHAIGACQESEISGGEGLLGTRANLFRPLGATAEENGAIRTPDLFTSPTETIHAAFQPHVTPLAAEPLFSRKAALRQRHKQLVGRLAAQTRRAHRHINLDLIRMTGSRIETATVAQLEQRVKTLECWLADPLTSRASSTGPSSSTIL